jgi:predicted NAD/FAD-binding protein
VQTLIRPWREHLRLSTPVTEICRHPSHVTVSSRGCEPERFDVVVLATHSDQALALLADPGERERELLGAIPYQQNEVVLHTDRSLLPRRRRAWASWNFHLGDGAPGRCTATYHLNRLQSLRADREFCVTLNRTEAIDPEQILWKTRYAHPVYTPAGVAAQARHQEISGSNRTHYCGAYWGWGFHEDGLNSAQRVASELTLQRTDPVRI